METIKFTRKKQFLTFLNETVSTKCDEIRHLESIVDKKFIETVGYQLGFEYTEQYSYDMIFKGYEGEKAIINNIQRTTLWDMSYHANGLMAKMNEQIEYLQFAIEHGKKFATYGECIKAWFEFKDNGTIPTEIDTEKVEKVESFDDENCNNQVEFLNAVQKDLENYSNRQARKKQLNEETIKNDAENIENVEKTEETAPCKNCKSCKNWQPWDYDGHGLHMGTCEKTEHATTHDDGTSCKNYTSRVPTGHTKT